MHRTVLRTTLRLSQATVFLALVIPSAIAQDAPVPNGLRDAIFGAHKHPTANVSIGGHAFRGIVSRDGMPVLVWSRDAKSPLKLPFDRAAFARWINGADKEFKHLGFEASFKSNAKYLDMDAWVFELSRKGVPLFDHWVKVYWKDKIFVGMLNHFPAPATSVVEPTDGDRSTPDRVYYAQADAKAEYRLVIATLSRRETATHRRTEVVTRRGAEVEIWQQKDGYMAPAGAATFSEYTVPSGTFPDQIWADSTGIIWFSQPSNNWVTSFNPKTSKFTQYATTGGSGPDGLWVDDKDRVWTGLYYSSHLGVLDVATKKFTAFAAPYTPASLAIPSPSSRDTIWVTDHKNNRISEFDPKQSTWLGSHVMPTSATWVVAGTVDRTRERVWFTGYSSNSLPYKDIGKPIGEVPTPTRGGPSFLVYNDNKIWYSNWLNNRLGMLDVASSKFTEYTYRAGETGGPIAITPTGKPVIGGKVSHIVVFDPVSKTFTDYAIPSSRRLKDGITVSPDGAIWFTGTYTNKIARLVIK